MKKPMATIQLDEAQLELLITVLGRAAYGLSSGAYREEIEKLLLYITSIEAEYPDADYKHDGD